ncbi:TPA: hypothetical protein TUY07_001915 [Streptococcus equi subsp. zooepidemicus]|nr:hypothetical protein [Streptococcus equi subsp. zooepidemicus]HEL0000301.1 hypothetical protein [Streptococcus equi subsp. zooepidemicus]HEL0596025.1 hypothetical protein [Streptococcus equi subsp. zooepidemicus]HEL0719318.1 hypothetical protein [Streptococcus equi subsp. zooepidemicus]HEL0816818.1 hypothetical protein [Streptococcus equi subsp. zooepidemicus]
MKKRNKYLSIGATFLASTTILLACSNTSKPSTNTSHSQEKTSSEKTKEVSIGNYINQSKKAPQLWYEIDGEEVIKGVYVFEDNQVIYYDTSYEKTTNTETTISSAQFKADYVGKNVYSTGQHAQGFFDSFYGTDTAEKISEEMLTDIIKKYDTEDGNADGIIDITIPDTLTLQSISTLSDDEIIEQAKAFEKASTHKQIIFEKVSLALRQLVDGKDTTPTIDKLTETENQYNQKVASDYQLKILPDEDLAETLEETLTIPIKKLSYDDVINYTYIIKEDSLTAYLTDSQFASNSINNVEYIGFPTFVTKQKEGDNVTLIYDTYDLRPDNVQVTSDSADDEE